MTDKAVISDLTWRSLKMQKDAFPDMPIYELPNDMVALFRSTTRKSADTLHVISLGIIAKTEENFKEFIKQAWKRGWTIKCHESGQELHPSRTQKNAIAQWRDARRNGAAKKGGEERAKKAEEEFWEKFSKIASRWHSDETSKSLMKEAGLKHHDTIRANLGYTRWEWRKLSDAQRARILKRTGRKEIKSSIFGAACKVARP